MGSRVEDETPRCKNCGKAIGSAWAKSDEFAASGYCGMCLNGPLPTAPDAARPAESVEDVLAEGLTELASHAKWGGYVVQRDIDEIAAKLSGLLAEAGIGSLAQARAEGAQAALLALADDIDTRGYGWTSAKDAGRFKARLRARAAAQQAATRGQGEGVGR